MPWFRIPRENASTNAGPEESHVAGDNDPLGFRVGTNEGGEADSESMGNVSIKLIGHRATDVVGLDDLIEN